MTPPSPARGPLLVLALVVVLLLGVGGGVAAAPLITGAQIKDNTVSTKDVKNRSLKLKDIKKSAVAKLHGKDGQPGQAGASAFAPPPPGTVLTGGGITSGWADSQNDTVYGFVQLPVTLAQPLDDADAGRNLYGGPHSAFPAVDESAARCAGSHTAPTATPGTLCVYVAEASNTIDAQVRLRAGSAFGGDAAERSGFTLTALSEAAGTVLVRYVWVYVAP